MYVILGTYKLSILLYLMGAARLPHLRGALLVPSIPLLPHLKGEALTPLTGVKTSSTTPRFPHLKKIS